MVGFFEGVSEVVLGNGFGGGGDGGLDGAEEVDDDGEVGGRVGGDEDFLRVGDGADSAMYR